MSAQQLHTSTFRNRGYTALFAVIVISLVLLITVVSSNVTGFMNMELGLLYQYKNESEVNAESCIEIALLRKQQYENYLGDEIIKIGDLQCEILPVVSGDIIETRATSTKNVYTNLRAFLDNGDKVLHVREIATFSPEVE